MESEGGAKSRPEVDHLLAKVKAGANSIVIRAARARARTAGEDPSGSLSEEGVPGWVKPP